jgi:uncharacterized flavoprotein (TIGR03862 family)
MTSPTTPPSTVAIVGAGPAGLMAAERLALAGVQVDVYDAMPSVGRKFLLAGRGGLNLTHSEPAERFASRYGSQQPWVQAWLHVLGPQALREWAAGLGVSTFVGSSGRVFPTDMKAAPLLRAWLHRLRGQGVRFHMRHRLTGFVPRVDAAPSLLLSTAEGDVTVQADAVVLALGGASWARLGSDGAWFPWLADLQVPLAPLQPSNCGFAAAHPGPDGALQPGWSEHFSSRFAGQPLKNLGLSVAPSHGLPGFAQVGECVVTQDGLEGSGIYAASAAVRERINAQGQATLLIDLLPQRSAEFVLDEVSRPRGPRSLSTHLKSRLGLDGARAGLLHELLPREALADAPRLAAAIKALPLTLTAPRPMDEAISTAGGVRAEGLNAALMLTPQPGLFCAGEMLDWEAPTGGYLLTGCLASGHVAGEGAAAWVRRAR